MPVRPPVVRAREREGERSRGGVEGAAGAAAAATKARCWQRGNDAAFCDTPALPRPATGRDTAGDRRCLAQGAVACSGHRTAAAVADAAAPRQQRHSPCLPLWHRPLPACGCRPRPKASTTTREAAVASNARRRGVAPGRHRRRCFRGVGPTRTVSSPFLALPRAPSAHGRRAPSAHARASPPVLKSLWDVQRAVQRAMFRRDQLTGWPPHLRP